MEDRGEIIIFQTEDGETKLNVNLRDESVWLSLDQMSVLFGRDKSTISRHIRNVFAEGELTPSAVVANFATTAADGKTYQVDYQNDICKALQVNTASAADCGFRHDSHNESELLPYCKLHPHLGCRQWQTLRFNIQSILLWL